MCPQSPAAEKRRTSSRFNTRLQPTHIGLGTTSTTSGVLALDYSYGATNNNGNVRSQTITAPELTLVQSYEYDEVNRLKSAREMNGATESWKQGFTYLDASGGNARFGNRRIDAAHTTASLITENPQFNPANNRIAPQAGELYEYDAAGNLTKDQGGNTFAYDGENRQATYNGGASIYGGATYSYDGDGKRVKKVAGVVSTVFVYDAMGQLVAEYGSAAATANGTQYLTADHLGTPRVVTLADGRVKARHDYLPFGEEVGAGIGGRTTNQGYSGDSVRQKFAGSERDAETGLDFMQARYYSSQAGRFTSPDDFLNDTHVNDPASWNLYVYVRNNPLSYIDPTGEEIYNTNLSEEERKRLIDDWKSKTGYQNIYFDKNSKLVIDTAAGFKGGSADARTLLSDAVNTTEKRFNLSSVDSKSVAFAQVDAGTITQNAAGKQVGPVVFNVRLDFKDHNQLRGDKEAIAAFSIGIGALHEIAHKLYKEIPDTPNSDTNPGPVENTYINPIRRQLGLAERVYYSAKPVPASLKPFYPNGGNQLTFRLNGKDKILRWQSDKVGGKVQ